MQVLGLLLMETHPTNVSLCPTVWSLALWHSLVYLCPRRLVCALDLLFLVCKSGSLPCC